LKGLVLAAALGAAALLPAAAGAAPPTTSGIPLGSNACFVVATPALPGTCNFTGAANGIGYGGGTDGSYSLTHIRKTNVCTVDPADGINKVSSYKADVVADAAGEAGDGYTPFDFEDGPSFSFTTGRVYTFTITGNGFGAAGGQTGPATAEPATPSASDWAGADTSGASALGTPC